MLPHACATSPNIASFHLCTDVGTPLTAELALDWGWRSLHLVGITQSFTKFLPHACAANPNIASFHLCTDVGTLLIAELVLYQGLAVRTANLKHITVTHACAGILYNPFCHFCNLVGTLLTAELALDRGLAVSTAGGTHHAFAGHGSGFCILNDLAVTALELQRRGAVQRVLVLDLDVHQVRYGYV